MERALLERCPNTLTRKLFGNLKVKSRMVPDLALPNCGFRSITTVASTPKPARTTPTTSKRVTPAAPTYTSLEEIIIPSDSASPEESVNMSSPPRKPMRNRLVEKAARAYLKPSDSFTKSRLQQSSSSSSSSCSSSSAAPWTQSLSRFLPHLSMSENPFNAFNSAVQAFRFYVTGGATAFQHPIVSRPFSMPLHHMSYAHANLPYSSYRGRSYAHNDLSIRWPYLSYRVSQSDLTFLEEKLATVAFRTTSKLYVTSNIHVTSNIQQARSQVSSPRGEFFYIRLCR